MPLLAGVYIDLLDNVNNNRRISMRLFSYSLLVPTGLLHPTPLCQIANETLLPLVVLGKVNSEKNKRSTRVSINSSPSGFVSSKSPSPSVGPSRDADPSNNTLSADADDARFALVLRPAQKNWSSQSLR